MTLVALAWSSLAFCGEIHDAAKSGDLEKVKALLKDNPDLVFSKDEEGRTPLHWAAWEGHKDVAELLLASNAEVNAKDNYGTTPLYYAAQRGKDVAELLLAKGAEVNAKDNSGHTPLHAAAFQGDVDVAQLLLANKADVNAKDNSGHTPLHDAAAQNRKDVVELLRQHGGQGTDALPPIINAINTDDIDKVKAIVATTPDAINATDRDGMSVLECASFEAQMNHAQRLVVSLDGTARGTAEPETGTTMSPIEEFLISKATNINAKSPPGYTALSLAVSEKESAFAKALINKGADVNTTDKAGSTPLLEAAFTGDLDLFKALIAAGARMDAKRNDGQTAMHIAADWGNAEVVEYLIQKGADVNAKDSNGATPLKLANSRSEYGVAALLKKNGGVE